MNKKGFVVGIFVLIVFVVLIIFYFSFFSNQIKFCNDGTVEETCSKIKPYFCIRGELIENASFCGCSNVSKIEGEKCISSYHIGTKMISLNYTLRGKSNLINFSVYEGMYNYTSEIPRYLDANEDPTLKDFKLKTINDEQQRELLLPLVIKIQNLAETKEDQARIAINLIQNIPFGNSNKTFRVGNTAVDYQRYPYEVLYENEGICSEKSELLVFLLREIGYDTAFLYYHAENHEAVGIKCPIEKSVKNNSYCFVETTGPSIISDDKTEYVNGDTLKSIPQIINISSGLILGEKIYEYKDAKDLINIRNNYKKKGSLSVFEYLKFKSLKKKYGLVSFSYSGV